MQKEISYIRLKKRLPIKSLKIAPPLFQPIFVKTKINFFVFIVITKEVLHPENSFFDIRSKKKFLSIEESFVDSKKFSLIQRNFFSPYIKEKFL